MINSLKINPPPSKKKQKNTPLPSVYLISLVLENEIVNQASNHLEEQLK